MLLRTTICWMLLASSIFAAQKIVVVVDDSGSMSDWMRSERIRKIDAARQSLVVVLKSLPRDAKVGVLALNAGWLVPLQTLDRERLQRSIRDLKARGSTPLGERMREASDELLALRKKDIYGDYRLLVVTDGEAGDQELLAYVLPDIMSRGFVVDVIGVDMESEHSLATRVHNYRRADDPASLSAAIASSLAESDASDVVAGESDFELLAPLPVEITPVVISALTSANNVPVTGEGFDHDEFYKGTGGNFGNSGGGSGFGFGGILCIGILFFIIASLSSMFRAIVRPTNRRRRW